MNDKVDFKKTMDSYRAKYGQFRLVDIPPLQYLMIDGHGDPNTAPEYMLAIEALYPVSYTLKFASKRDLGRDYVVPPLEGLWWAEDMAAFTTARDASQWQWTLMMLVPEWIEPAMVDDAVAAVRTKHQPPPRVDDVRLETLDEGQSVQTLHIGPYDDEGPVIAQLHTEFLPQHGLHPTGKHHEIYFSDPRRAAPQKLRTLLRQPVEAD